MTRRNALGGLLLLSLLGLAAALGAFLVAKPVPIQVLTRHADIATPSGAVYEGAELLSHIHAGPITVHRETAVMVMAEAGPLTLALLDSIQVAASSEDFAFFLRGRPTVAILDPAAGLQLGPSDIPFPTTLILVQPGHRPLISPAPLGVDSLRALMRHYRGLPGSASVSAT